MALLKELSQYEIMRMKNMEERQALLDTLISESKKLKEDIKENTAKRKRKRVSVFKELNLKEVDCSTDTIDWDLCYEPPRTRSRGRRTTLDGDLDELPLTYRFSFMKSRSEDENRPAKKRRHSSYTHASVDPNVNVLLPDDVTPAMLAAVAQGSGNKQYTASGTTCHQCRQKTSDTKSVCRSLRCVGVRGYFCGPCLQNRYGEEVTEVLIDPEWCCPPCRGTCNCSICRNRAGMPATGILINLARASGFTNVDEYLQSLCKKEELS